MKLGISLISFGILAAALVGSAAAASPKAAEPLTIAHSWSIEQEMLVRQFSVGLGVDLAIHEEAAQALAVKVAFSPEARDASAPKCAPLR